MGYYLPSILTILKMAISHQVQLYGCFAPLNFDVVPNSRVAAT
jgi:hypothetical protein